MKIPRRATGFTLVELSLSLAFIGVLSLTTVLIINNTVLAYRRGLTLNQVNTVGMELVDDIRTTVQNSPAQRCSDDSSDNTCHYFVKEGNITIEGGNKEVPVWGSICFGQYSYIWKSGYDSSAPTTFRLLKIKNSGNSVCVEAQDTSFNPDTYIAQGEELISDDSGLALYNLTVSNPAISSATNSAYYSISFILGTISGGPNITATGDYCQAPEETNSSFNYCAINKFNFAAQAGGGTNAP